jgi:hypothetical protein
VTIIDSIGVPERVISAQLRKNIFESPVAHAYIACASSQDTADELVVGLALYFYNFSTWTGKAGIYVSFISEIQLAT